jgi:hypothetical protein
MIAATFQFAGHEPQQRNIETEALPKAGDRIDGPLLPEGEEWAVLDVFCHDNAAEISCGALPVPEHLRGDAKGPWIYS